MKGEVDLSELDLADDNEYDCVWCLVDTGAGASVANQKRHFPGSKVNRSKPNDLNLATASGENMSSDGTFIVEAETTERPHGDKLRQCISRDANPVGS